MLAQTLNWEMFDPSWTTIFVFGVGLVIVLAVLIIQTIILARISREVFFARVLPELRKLNDKDDEPDECGSKYGDNSFDFQPASSAQPTTEDELDEYLAVCIYPIDGHSARRRVVDEPTKAA